MMYSDVELRSQMFLIDEDVRDVAVKRKEPLPS
jgi:hypothetical protein